MSQDIVHIEDSWKQALMEEFEKPYFKNLSAFIHNEYAHHTVYPKSKDIFRAFDLCPFKKVRVVIVGQDPYHGEHQANGLCFAVHKDIKIPPSLRNIYKEIESDTGTVSQKNGDLSSLAEQGVLLLNATLTVRAHTPGSHQKKGWEEFTDMVIETLSREREHIVFILWGNYAKTKGMKIDRTKHLVLEAAHPSPFSAHSGFFGCKHFSKTNTYLRHHGLGEITWS